GQPDRLAFHRAGEADAERLLRELQRPHARRTSQREPVPLSRSRAPDNRQLGRRLQPTSAAFRARLRIVYAANLTATRGPGNPDQPARPHIAPPTPDGVNPAEALIAAEPIFTGRSWRPAIGPIQALTSARMWRRCAPDHGTDSCR